MAHKRKENQQSKEEIKHRIRRWLATTFPQSSDFSHAMVLIDSRHELSCSVPKFLPITIVILPPYQTRSNFQFNPRHFPESRRNVQEHIRRRVGMVLVKEGEDGIGEMM